MRDGIGIAALPGAVETREQRHILTGLHLLQQAEQPIQCACFIADPTLLHRLLQTLRIGEGTDGQRGTRQLQQRQQRSAFGSGAVRTVTFIPIVFRLIVCMMMSVTRRVGTRLRFERRDLSMHGKTEPAQHSVQYRIVAITQARYRQLHRHMAIGEVITGAQQQLRIRRNHDRNRFGRGAHPHQRARIAQQQIAVAQPRAARQHQRGLAALIERRAQTTALAPLPVQRQCRRGRAAMRRERGEPQQAMVSAAVHDQNRK